MSKPANALETELKTFEEHLAEWSAEEGRFAVIAGTEIIGIFDTYHDAVTAGYGRRGLEPFLVKQIAAIAKIANFTRNLVRECPILVA